jgi:hypothetical protein
MSDEFKYVEKARKLGVDVENPTAMHYLVNGIRYCEARFQNPTANRSQLADILGLRTPEEVDFLRRNNYIGIASEIVFETLMEEMAQTDLRQRILKLYHDDYYDWLSNMSRIAAGKAPADGGKRPLDRDQVAAFTALQSTQTHEAFLKMLFLPDQTESAESQYLVTRKQLQDSSDVIDLDSPTNS